MSLILSVKDESNFKPCPAGSHHATCIRIIDLGTQLVEYQNEQKRQHKILVQWEIDPEGDPEMLMPDGSLPHQPPVHRQPAQQKPTGNRPQKLARKGLYTGRTRQLRFAQYFGQALPVEYRPPRKQRRQNHLCQHFRHQQQDEELHPETSGQRRFCLRPVRPRLGELRPPERETEGADCQKPGICRSRKRPPTASAAAETGPSGGRADGTPPRQCRACRRHRGRHPF